MLIFLLFLLSIVRFCGAVDEPFSCLNDWKANTATGCCYKFVKKVVTRDEAQNECRIANSNLASIHSADENQFIGKNLAILVGLGGGFSWIGLKRIPVKLYQEKRSVSAAFETFDGSTVSYTNWPGGRPFDQDGYDCVVMQLDIDLEFKWLDWTCIRSDQFLAFVCKDCNPFRYHCDNLKCRKCDGHTGVTCTLPSYATYGVCRSACQPFRYHCAFGTSMFRHSIAQFMCQRCDGVAGVTCALPSYATFDICRNACKPPTTTIGTTTMTTTTTTSKPTTTAPQTTLSLQVRRCSIEANKEFSGVCLKCNPLWVHGVPVTACCDLCAAMPECIGWSWNTVLDGTCWFKEQTENSFSASNTFSSTVLRAVTTPIGILSTTSSEPDTWVCSRGSSARFCVRCGTGLPTRCPSDRKRFSDESICNNFCERLASIGTDEDIMSLSNLDDK